MKLNTGAVVFTAAVDLACAAGCLMLAGRPLPCPVPLILWAFCIMFCVFAALLLGSLVRKR